MEAGLRLSVLPSLGENGYMTLDLRAELTSLTRTSPGSPVKDGQVVENTVMVKDGDSVLLGGFTRTVQRDQRIAASPCSARSCRSSSRAKSTARPTCRVSSSSRPAWWTWPAGSIPARRERWKGADAPKRRHPVTHRHSILLGTLFLATTLAPASQCAGASPGGAAWKPSWEARIAPRGEPGETFILEGRVISFPDSQPLAHVRVRAYHADASGKYRSNGPGGSLSSGDHGEYRVVTVLPGRAEGEPHVHFEIYPDGQAMQFFTVTLARLHGAGSDSAYARLPYLLQLPDDSPWQYVEYDARGALHTRVDLVAGWAQRVPPR